MSSFQRVLCTGFNGEVIREASLYQFRLCTFYLCCCAVSTDHVSPTKKNPSKWEISVSVKEDYKKKNVSVVITLANKTEEFITIGDCNTTTVHQYIEYIEGMIIAECISARL